ncbi:UDP-N-acetylmuramoyl-tripeptide--D-alanyl-D-alanine ligase [Cyanobium gracile UHCC 0139]|uniref:UDP-N-acetylmuramoyl-tripeptide--D-alanyl-D-alanine ligase n=1 Tax=Cyanobium gracile UHCC 0139 TaxID=3110308 RepID=A0ABU5RRF6_9CYAN|nr:UDP-N-acetylmuramoyl-tripeptide--D-alanyl-D-alanine ligase [Cyanobium gracile]MEA5390361.1 UDP-N-acetylmuramoyl-tripeptide--D-alanyl-D-alanine ligase [Cyanobium gracile UHCC 0139]
MLLPFEPLCQLWGEPLMAPRTAGPDPIRRVCTDSRGDLGGALFVPLVGERFDGHRFVADAFAAGAAAALVQRDRLDGAALAELVAGSGRPIWPVEDTLEAYQQLARLRRRQLGLPVVAVTGSAGKTTTRELIRAALAPLGPVVASSGNENNDVGAPLTILKADACTAALVVEMGMRGLGEIDRLSRCAEPDVAVITNIGTAHIGRLGSREAIGRAKCEITAGLGPEGVLVIPAGDPLLEESLGRVWRGRVVRVALEDEAADFPAGVPAAELVGRLEGPSLCLLDGPSLALPLEGRHNARNLLLAVAVARELGVPAAALGDLAVQLPGGRARRAQLGGVELLDETYNASPEAVLAALELLGAPGGACEGRRYAVLGTMLELGDRSLELHRQVAGRARALGLDGLVIVAAEAEAQAMLAAAAGLPRLARAATPEEAAALLLDWLEPGDRVLLKASRGVALERAIPLLEAGLGPAA